MATSSAKKSSPKSGAPSARPTKKATVTAPKRGLPEAPSAPSEAAVTLIDPAILERTPKATAPQLRKKDLVARVITALDGKKKGQVKEIVEATLAALGEALQRGESLNLPPFGRARIARQKGEGKTSSMTVKLRGAGEKNAAKGSKQALAEADEDD